MFKLGNMFNAGKGEKPPKNQAEKDAVMKYLKGGMELTALALLLNVTPAQAEAIAANYAPSGEGKTISYTPTKQAEAYNPFATVKAEENDSEEGQKGEEFEGGNGDKLDVAPTPADTVEGYVQKGRREFNFDKTGNGEMWDYYGTVSADKTPCKNGPFYTNDSYEEKDLRQLGTVFGTGGENYILCYNFGPDKNNPGKYVAHIVKVPAATKVYRPKGGNSDEIYLAKCGNRLVPVKQIKPDDEPTEVEKKDPKPKELDEPTVEHKQELVAKLMLDIPYKNGDREIRIQILDQNTHTNVYKSGTIYLTKRDLVNRRGEVVDSKYVQITEDEWETRAAEHSTQKLSGIPHRTTGWEKRLENQDPLPKNYKELGTQYLIDLLTKE